ncbi:MAG: lytic murein transglycosylase [Desulfobulbaceae bacterium]|nr:lytic murein transglycosylase [Desulfobulbaceae bacterium]
MAADLVQDKEPIDFRQQKFTALFVELQDRHQFTAAQLRSIFTGLTIDRRVLVLMDKQWEARPYYQYAPQFITGEIIRTGRAKLEEHRRLLDLVEQRFGVDREILVAIWGIETRYGANQGNYNVLRTLTTLFDAYPRRAQFFRQELIHFLLLCRETGTDPRQVNGSYAGAFGQTQFIPSSFRKYAVSFDGDRKRDVWNSVPDILASIANYLKQFGWTLNTPIYAELGTRLNSQELLQTEQAGRKGRISASAVAQAQQMRLPPVPGDKRVSIVGLELPPATGAEKRYIAGYPNFHAITEWNHSNRYAMAVTELAEALAQ